MVKKYEEKPSPIKAIRLTEENAVEAARWTGGQLTWAYDADSPRLVKLTFPTGDPAHNRPQEVERGLWIIKHESSRSFSQVTDESFRAVYREVE